MSEEKKPLLLHVCCAPCALGCLGELLDRKVTFYYSNSNINTEEEFRKRFAPVVDLAEANDIELLVDPYEHEDWLQFVSKVPDYEKMPEHGARCPACFQYTLGRAAQLASELGMNFTTTLTVSPYKDTNTIFGVCLKYPNFEPYDFKKNNGYQTSIQLSKEAGIYRQPYCGCEFSFKDYLRRKEEREKTKLRQVF